MFVIQIGAGNGNTDKHRGVDEVWEGVTQHGWKAVILEPSPKHFYNLERNYYGYREAGTEQVILLQMAVAEYRGIIDFYDCEMDETSTLIEKVLARNNYHNGKTKNYQKIEVLCTTINDLLQTYGLPDYLVVDTEGFDCNIVNMLDLKHYPIPKIRFEFSHMERDQDALAELGKACLKLIKADYTLTHDMADIVAERL
jgi:FkbM family methyltransferase